MGVVLVTVAGNHAEKRQVGIDIYPALFQGEGLTDMIVVGASSYDSRRAPFSQVCSCLPTYAHAVYLCLFFFVCVC